MPFVHGKGAAVSVDNASGTLVDISAFANSVDMPRPIDTAETSTFGQNAKTYIAGQNDSTVSISGLYDAATDAMLSAVMDALANDTLASVTVQYRPAGTGVGKPQYVCEVIWTSYDVSAGVGDPVSFSLEGQRTGPTTRSVQ